MELYRSLDPSYSSRFEPDFSLGFEIVAGLLYIYICVCIFIYVCVCMCTCHVYTIGKIGSDSRWDPGLLEEREGKEREKRKRKEKARREKCGKLAGRREVFEEPKRVSLRNEHNIGLRYRWMHFGLAIRCPTQRYKEFVYPV